VGTDIQAADWFLVSLCYCISYRHCTDLCTWWTLCV